MALTKLTDIRKSLSVEIEDLQVNGITTFTGNVSIGGTLTYQDVTNVDALGIGTFRAGIDITGGNLTIPDKIIHSGDTNTFIRFPSNDSFSVTTNNVTRMNFTGNFIDLPDAGTFRLGNSNDLQIYHGSGGASNIVHSNTSQPLRISATGAGSITFDTNSSERLRILANGNIGIGTDNPQYLDANFRELTISGGSEGAGLHLQDGNANVVGGFFTSDNTNAMIIRTRSNHPLIFRTNNTERLRIASDGKVRIGSGTPQLALLHISPADYSLNLQNNSNNKSMILFSKNSAGNDARAWIEGNGENNGYLAFAAGDGERLRITNTGNVGIGTNNPSQIFNIYGQNVKPVIGHITAHTPLYSSYNGQNNTSLEITSSGTGTNVAGLTINNPTTSANSSYKTISFSCSGTSSSEKRGCIISSNHDEDSSSTIKGNFYVSTNNGSGLQQNLQINHDGYVRKPNQPSFHVYTVTGTQNSVLTFSSTHHNNGNHMNAGTGTFTCPVDGRYLFTFAFLHNTSPTSYARVLFQLNGSKSTQWGDTLCDDTGLYINTSMSMIFNLSTNDVVRLYNEGNNIYGSQYGAFSGCLLF